jgi:hypothetical protein
MGATEFAFNIRKRYQTNELAVDSTEFGTSGSEESLPGYPSSLSAGPSSGFPRTLISNFWRPDGDLCPSHKQTKAKTTCIINRLQMAVCASSSVYSDRRLTDSLSLLLPPKSLN